MSKKMNKSISPEESKAILKFENDLADELGISRGRDPESLDLIERIRLRFGLTEEEAETRLAKWDM